MKHQFKLLLLAVALFFTLLAMPGWSQDRGYVPMGGRISATDTRMIWIDPVSGHLINTDDRGAALHSGTMFSVSRTVVLTSGASDTVYLEPLSGSSKHPHLWIEVNTAGAATFEFVENPQITASGTELTSYNRKRDETATAGMELFHTFTSTGTASGTTLDESSLGGGFAVGNTNRTTTAWVLSSSKRYYFNIKDRSAANNRVTIKFIWYEHEEKN